jgi:hypothetical protein
MLENEAPRVEISADLARQRVTLRFVGFIKLGHAIDGKKLYREAIAKLNGKPYTALTYLHQLRIMDPEAVEVIKSMVADAGRHRCVRSARVVGATQWTVKMQFKRIDNQLNNYQSEFFTDEDQAIRFLDQADEIGNSQSAKLQAARHRAREIRAGIEPGPPTPV